MSFEQTLVRQWQDYDMKEYAENYDLSNSQLRTKAHISCLYPEILALIFGYLDVRDKGRVARVCAAWKEASYYKCVWRGVEARLHLRRANPSLFPSLVRRGIRRVQVLSLRRSLRDVIQGLPNIERLNLSGCYNLTDSWLGHAFSREVTTLVELHLGMCKQITDSSIGRISTCLPNLEILDLGGCSGITNTSLQLIANELKRLQRLNLRSCRHISDMGISHLAGLGGSTEGSVANLSLKYLGLQDCQKLTDDALKYASLGLVHLRGVNLSFCSGVTDFGLKHLARMSSLQELNLRSCDGVSDTGMAFLAEGGSRVVSLDVSFCEKVGDRGMLHISQGLFHLKCLSLNSCSVSDEGISRIATTLTELHTLYIGQCSRVTDKGLGLIAENLRRLTCIDLYGCPKLTKGGLEKIMQLPNLSEINLGLWQKNPDIGMKLFCNF